MLAGGSPSWRISCDALLDGGEVMGSVSCSTGQVPSICRTAGQCVVDRAHRHVAQLLELLNRADATLNRSKSSMADGMTGMTAAASTVKLACRGPFPKKALWFTVLA